MKGILCFFKFLIKKKIFQRIINYFFTTKLHEKMEFILKKKSVKFFFFLPESNII